MEDFVGFAGNQGSADGVGTTAKLSMPFGMALTTDDSVLFFVDYGNHRIREINISTGVVTTVTGLGGASGYADGDFSAAMFTSPTGIALTSVDMYNAGISAPDAYGLVVESSRIRYLNFAAQAVSTVAGGLAAGYQDGFGNDAMFEDIVSIVVSPDDTFALISDSTRLRKLVLSTQHVSTLIGNSTGGAGYMGPFRDAAISNNGEFALLAVNMDDDPNYLKLYYFDTEVLETAAPPFTTMKGVLMRPDGRCEI